MAGTISMTDKVDQLSDILSERILLLDGAMGTMIQRLTLDEKAVRGERFADHHKDLSRFFRYSFADAPRENYRYSPRVLCGRL